MVVSVCRAQPLSVEGVDPEGVYRVQIDDEPASHVVPRVTRSISILLGKQATRAAASGRRASSLGMMRFLDLLIVGEEDRFVERAVRITQLPPAEADAARTAIRAATPARTGRVT